MSITLKELIDLTKDHFHLRLLAGAQDMDYVVTWAHLMEFTEVTEFFMGNELAVTGGYALKSEEDFIRMADVLETHRGAGLVINLGKYVQTVPQSMIEHCNKIGMPLLTMPWDMYMTEFVRECCSLIDRSNQEEDTLAQMIQRIVTVPDEAGSCRPRLEERFQEKYGFTMLAIRARAQNLDAPIVEQRSRLRLHTALRPFSFTYLIFRQDRRLYIVANLTDSETVGNAARAIQKAIHTALPGMVVRIGIGDPVSNYESMSEAYQSATSAVRQASLQGQEIVRFRDMGFYKLLYSIPSESMMESYYQDTLAPLLQADGGRYGSYTETLFRYLLSDGSLQTVADQMYTHRNTVYYRMGKIRDLLGDDLEGQQQRLPYLLAYHIGVILKLVPPLE